MKNRKNCFLYFIIIILILSGCSYDEKSIIVKNGIKSRIIYTENSKYTVKKIIEKKYVDYFNKSGYFFKREFADTRRYFYFFEYDTFGNKVLQKTIRNDGEEGVRLSYKYDKKNNLLSETQQGHLINVYKNIYSDEKLSMKFVYSHKKELKKVHFYKYDWYGFLREELEIKTRYNYMITKIKYNFDISGKLKEKSIYQARLKSKPYIDEKNIRIFNENYPSEFYKLKNTFKYIYNDLNLLSEEIKLAPIGYELEKTMYEYFN